MRQKKMKLLRKYPNLNYDVHEERDYHNVLRKVYKNDKGEVIANRFVTVCTSEPRKKYQLLKQIYKSVNKKIRRITKESLSNESIF